MCTRLAASFAVMVVFISGCATTLIVDSTHRKVVEGYLASLTRRDLLALTAYTTVDVEWYTLVEGERIQEVSGRDGLAKSLQQIFDKYAAARWTVESAEVVGNRVAVRERTEWQEDGRLQARTSLGVYELSGGRIRRITYFLDGG